MSPRFDLGDYVDVDARLRWFFEMFPEGSLQSEVLLWPVEGMPIIVVKAYAHRSPNDEQPGQGLASEVYPGTTPYTKGSELMNAETSAWGRALAAIGAPTKGHIASADEVVGAQERRKARGEDGRPKQAPQAETQVEGGEPAREALGKEEGQVTLPAGKLVSTDHEHTWVQSPTMKDWVLCSSCRKALPKEDAGVST
jgi:hypothetical protein